MNTPISIIMTSYNRERYLATAIESVLAQTRKDFEFLILDDGSTPEPSTLGLLGLTGLSLLGLKRRQRK